MAIRLLPFRDYDEHAVINLFALANAAVNDKLNDSGEGDAGAFVTVTAGALDASPVGYEDGISNYMMGNHTIPHLGYNKYPEVPLKVEAAEKSDAVLGMTLRQTAKFDENGENLLRYPVKKDEYHALSPGQAVPIATKGIFMLDSRAIGTKKKDGSTAATAANLVPAAGQIAYLAGDAEGKLLFNSSSEGGAAVGTVLAVGSRAAQGPSNVDVHAGTVFLLKLEL